MAHTEPAAELYGDPFLAAVFASAEAHAADSEEPDHEVSDLQGVIRLLWELLPEVRRMSAVNLVKDHFVHDIGAEWVESKKR